MAIIPAVTAANSPRLPLTCVGAVLAVGFVACMPLTGCKGRVLAPNANDGLRAELVERTEERDAARTRVSELESEVARLSAKVASAASGGEEQTGVASAEIAALRQDAAAATPALASISISALSSAKVRSSREESSREGLLTLVIVPSDGLGRFHQVAGWLDVSATVLVPNAPPAPALATRVGPKALRDCYRSGFMGTHYTVEQPIRWGVEGAPRAVSVAIEFVDPATGRRFPATATVPFVPERAEPRD